MFGADWLIDDAFVENSTKMFDGIISDRAEKGFLFRKIKLKKCLKFVSTVAAAKKIVTIITEDDIGDRDSKKVPKGKDPEVGKERGGGGGRGAREVKTKGKGNA